MSNVDKIYCSLCLDLLKDPVTTTCGHSYCMSCIKDHWDTEDQKEAYSCPQCRQTFMPRPVVGKTNILAESVEDMTKSGLQAAPPDYAGPKDEACDVCTGRKHEAQNSCLRCLASFCGEHLQTHFQAPQLKKHKLVKPSEKLQKNICSHHDEVMKVFCQTDQQSVCLICVMDQHRGHDTVLAAEEMTERPRELQESRQNIQQRIQQKEKGMKLLQQDVEAINSSADKTVKESEKIFTELIRLMEQQRSKVKQQVRSQQQTEVSRVRELQEMLAQEITELKRKDEELKKLSHMKDHNKFLQDPSLSQLRESSDSTSIPESPVRNFDGVTAAVSELRDKLQDILSGRAWTSIVKTVPHVDFLLSEPETRSRSWLFRFSRDITLDPNTAYRHLLLSDCNRKVTLMSEHQPYPDHPDRFTYYEQVLSKGSLTRQCYWEVELRGEVCVAVSYKTISRDGESDICLFGGNNKSWSLYCYTDRYVFMHNKVRTDVSGHRSSRVGVYLNHRAGILSFYSVSETMTLLHRVQTTFTQPLHAGLWISLFSPAGSSAELCKLK